MATGPSDFWGQENADAFSSAFGRLATEMVEAAKLGPAYSLMTQPAATMAAAAAIGFGVSTQMASLFLGAMQGALDAASKTAEAFDETPPEEPQEPAASSETEQGAASAAPAAEAPRAPAAKPLTGKASRTGRRAVGAASARTARLATGKTATRRSASDDLKQIGGIGPKLEQVLKEKGVTRLAAIAAWSEEDVARFDAELALDGRIARDGWVKTAKALQKAKTKAGS